MTHFIRDGRAPIPEKESTSKIMQANKAANTKPEVLIRKALREAGLLGYRLHPRQLPGRPDIVFGRNKLAIFINGCFWHRCPTCDLPLPKSNTEFWENKFNANIARDQRKIKVLKKLGWRAMTIWECKISANPAQCAERIGRMLNKIN